MTIPPTSTTNRLTPLRSELLSAVPGLLHGITHRVDGLGKADGNISYSGDRDREDAWEMRQLWSEAIGIDPGKLVFTGLVHGNDVIEAHAGDAGAGASPDRAHLGLADVLVTNQPNLALVMTHADCLSILMVDPENRAIAAVHAGWRGTVEDVAGAAVRAMQARYDSDPANLLAYFGPGIGGCCNEVGPEVTAAWREQARDLGPLAELAVTKPGPKEHFDVPRANALLMQRAGVQPDHLEVSTICTKCSTADWFSHRGHGPTAGRQASIIMLTDEGGAT